MYWYWYWYLKVRYWYLYWYVDHWYWYWYWYLFVEYLIQDCYSLYNFHWATVTIRGSLQASIPIVKSLLAGFWSKIWLGHVTCK